MARILYDLAGADPELRFSPHCWRTTFALAHKGLEVERVPWRFTEKSALAFSGQGMVPVLVDGDRTVADSFWIACYLEDAYPNAPSLFDGPGGRHLGRFVHDWCATVLHPSLIPIILADIHAIIDPKDQAYFRESREKRFGQRIEEVGADRERLIATFRKALRPLRATLATQDFLGGPRALYADYTVMAAFQWARCVSTIALLEADDPLVAWRERMLDLHGGLARNAPCAA